MQKPKKEFDAFTAKKIIADYADKVNFYMKENYNLTRQIEDLKITVKINKDLIYKYISNTLTQGESHHILNDLHKENDQLIKRNEELYTEKNTLEKKLYNLISEREADETKFQISIEKLKEDLFVLKNKLNEKDNYIKLMRAESGVKSKKANDTLIVEPTKANVEINNELNATRELISKVSKMINIEKAKNAKLETKIKILEEAKGKTESKSNLKENLSNDQTLSSESSISEEQVQDQSNIKSYNEELADLNDSNEINFPDKVKHINMNNYNSNPLFFSHKKSASVIPKLNLKTIQTKYSENNKPASQIGLTSINVTEKPAQDQLKQTLEKLKSELRIKDEDIQKLKKKLKKYKKCLKQSKESIKELILVNEHLKKFSVSQSTEDVSNKRELVNEGDNIEN